MAMYRKARLFIFTAWRVFGLLFNQDFDK